MANAMLFYRTPSTRQADVPNPANLPTGQKLLFTPPADLASGITDEYTNNVVRKPPAAPAGRFILQTDEGVTAFILNVEGNFIIGAGNPDKLQTFAKLPQSDSYHIYGIFGLQYPNGPAYLTIDPDNTKGLMLGRRRGKHLGITKELFDFGVELSYGGTVS